MPMFKNNLDEFDDSREVVANLVEEYKAIEQPDYVNWNPTKNTSSNEEDVEMPH